MSAMRYLSIVFFVYFIWWNATTPSAVVDDFGRSSSRSTNDEKERKTANVVLSKPVALGNSRVLINKAKEEKSIEVSVEKAMELIEGFYANELGMDFQREFEVFLPVPSSSSKTASSKNTTRDVMVKRRKRKGGKSSSSSSSSSDFVDFFHFVNPDLNSKEVDFRVKRYVYPKPTSKNVENCDKNKRIRVVEYEIEERGEEEEEFHDDL